MQRPQALRSEQDPADWWQALEAVMDQLLADIFDQALTVHQDSESGGAMGAARLAWLATGGDLDTVCVTPPVRQRFEPDTARSDSLRARHARFGALYLALR